MAEHPNIDTAWVTLNRACNLRCRWCYAAGTGYKAGDDMSFELFCEIINLVCKLGVRKVTLTDGEPAIYPRVLESIRYCMTRGLDVTILTNGEGCVIPCNALPNVRLGRIHEDFSDRESFWKFWSSREVADRLSAIRSVPDARCDSCGMFDRCRGGCVSNWLDFSFEDSVFSNGD